ncbi:MAG: hypothetical protein LBD52_03160 [Prevotellaceae bacterium]|nr:hypothetical protein [Prevotellaceae bacterium]
MKKTILIMLVSVLCTGFVNAQVYLGGSLGFGTETEKPEVGDKTKTTSFSFAPEIGFGLNSNFELGIALALTNLKTDFGGNETKSNAWRVAPYARLSVIEFGNFSVWGQANLFVGGGEQNSQKATSFGLNIQPVLKYNLSDHFSLLANLNFLNLGFSQTKIKDVSTTTSFDLGVDSYNVVTLGDIAVGFIYKF